MDTVEFSQWLEGICRLSGEQIGVAMTALADFRDRPCPVPPPDSVESEESSTAGRDAAASAQGGRRGRSSRIDPGAVGKIGERKVESQGCAHCGGRDIVRWGLSRGLPRYRCKSCGRTFNAATNTPLSRLRKKAGWLAQAQAMIEGVSSAKAAE